MHRHDALRDPGGSRSGVRSCRHAFAWKVRSMYNRVYSMGCLRSRYPMSTQGHAQQSHNAKMSLTLYFPPLKLHSFTPPALSGTATNFPTDTGQAMPGPLPDGGTLLRLEPVKRHSDVGLVLEPGSHHQGTPTMSGGAAAAATAAGMPLERHCARADCASRISDHIPVIQELPSGGNLPGNDIGSPALDTGSLAQPVPPKGVKRRRDSQGDVQ